MISTRLIIFFVSTSLAGVSFASAQSNEVAATNVIVYELYSWSNGNGTFSFAVLPSPSGIGNTVDEILDRRVLIRNASTLKQKISTLPAGTTVYWLEKPASGPGPVDRRIQGFGYPPAKIVTEVRRFAEGHKVKLELSK